MVGLHISTREWMLMKRSLMLIFIFGVAGCSNQTDVTLGDEPADPDRPYPGAQPIGEEQQDDFSYRLVSTKEEYQVGEPVEIYAELVYEGDEERHNDRSRLFTVFLSFL